MHILITGASGFLGRKLIENLLQQDNHNIKALVHKNPVEINGCHEVRGNLNDLGSLKVATQGINTVIHLAAVTHTSRQEDYYKVNADGTKYLIEACAQNGVQRFIFMSSRAAHAEGGSYSESKLIAEKYVKESNMSWIIFQPAEVYGFGSSDAINKLIGWIEIFKFIPVIGDGKYKLSPVFIGDIVPAITRSITDNKLEGITFVLAGPEEISYNELIDRLCIYLNVKRYKIFVPVFLVVLIFRLLLLFKNDFFFQDQIPRLICSKPYNIELAAKYLNFKPRSLKEGLKLTL